MAARTIVDQMVAVLELDSSKFDAGIVAVMQKIKALDGQLKVATAGVTRGMRSAGASGEQAGQQISKGMGGGRMGIFMLIAAVYKLNEAFGLPGITRFVQEVADSETQTLRVAESLRLNTTELQAWQKVVQIHGGSVSGFNSGLEKMSANLGKIGTHVRGAKLLQQYLGLASVTDAMVQGRDALGVMRMFAEQMAGMTVQRQFLVGRRLGLDDATIRSLQAGGMALMDQVAAERKLAATNEELQNARGVAEAQAEANLQWERAKQVIGAAFLPMLQHLSTALREASKWIREHQTAVKVAVVVIGAALTALGVVAAAAATVVMLAGLKIAFGMTLATGGAWMIGVAAGVAALAAIAAAALLTAGSFDEIKDAHSGMVDEILGGDAKLKAAYEWQKKYNEILEKNAKRLTDLRKQMAEGRAAINEADIGSKAYIDRWVSYITGHVSDPKKLAELQQHQASVEETYRKFTEAGNWFQQSVENRSAQAWQRNPQLAMRVAHGIEAAQYKEADVKINQVTIQVGSAKEVLDVDINTHRITVTHGAHTAVHQIAGGQR